MFTCEKFRFTCRIIAVRAFAEQMSRGSTGLHGLCFPEVISSRFTFHPLVLQNLQILCILILLHKEIYSQSLLFLIQFFEKQYALPSIDGW